ncbi:MAG: nucleoside-triphosphatase [Peptococcaceae bacterium]|jgi:nucleoside-triphosphatase|nr:nucleoside-triphosphatase [Peptococcaceae bacterium]
MFPAGARERSGPARIFLTGERQVGKSTLIKKYVKETGVAAAGFLTYWLEGDKAGDEGEGGEGCDGDEGCEGGDGGERGAKGNPRRLFISPFADPPPVGERYLIAWQEQAGGRPRVLHDVFDDRGAAILRDAGSPALIVMDELGVMESGSPGFQRAVLERLAGDIPILGVIQARTSPFLDRLRGEKGVELVEITVDNREEALVWLLRRRVGCTQGKRMGGGR